MGCCKSDELRSFVDQVYDVKDLETRGAEAQFRAVRKKRGRDPPTVKASCLCCDISLKLERSCLLLFGPVKTKGYSLNSTVWTCENKRLALEFYF